jgi:ATP-binding cassette subfamily B protein
VVRLKGAESQKSYSFARLARRVVPLCYSAAPGLNWLGWIFGVIQALLSAATIVLSKNLFDAIGRAAAGEIGFWGCVSPLLALAAATFGFQIFNGIVNFLISVYIDKTCGVIKRGLHDKLQRVGPERFEDTAFLDDLNRAGEGANAIPFFAFILQGILTFYCVYFAFVGAYLFRMKPLLLFTLLIAFLPALLAQVVKGRVFTALEKQSAPLRRENEAYQRAICDREFLKETRVLGAFPYFYRLFTETLRLLTDKAWRAERKTALLELLLNVSTFAGMAASAYLLFDATMAGEVTVGAFAAVYASLGSIFDLMREIITTHFGNLNRDIGKIANFFRLMDAPERTRADVGAEPALVEAAGVSFTYPGRDAPAVRDVTLRLARGETVAIVGENGAGKTTLVRLLTGLYQPDSGRVTIRGADTVPAAVNATASPMYATASPANAVPTAVRTTPSPVRATASPATAASSTPTAAAGAAAEYRGVSGVFQNYQRYKMSLAENVEISDTAAPSGAAPADSGKVDGALRAAGLDYRAEGWELDTMLSPEFDGVDLSGGQWQRVAIARGLYRANGFIVLDEPTAAIDPIEETRIYRQFQKIAEGKCAVIVTHRLGSARLAHRIIVMDGGRIVDVGTHAELLSRPGRYAELWRAQSKWYDRADREGARKNGRWIVKQQPGKD